MRIESGSISTIHSGIILGSVFGVFVWCLVCIGRFRSVRRFPWISLFLYIPGTQSHDSLLGFLFVATRGPSSIARSSCAGCFFFPQ